MRPQAAEARAAVVTPPDPDRARVEFSRTHSGRRRARVTLGLWSLVATGATDRDAAAALFVRLRKMTAAVELAGSTAARLDAVPAELGVTRGAR